MDCDRNIDQIYCSVSESDLVNCCVAVENNVIARSICQFHIGESSSVKKEVVDLGKDFSVCLFFDLGIDDLSMDLNVKKESVDFEENDLAMNDIVKGMFY